MATDHIDVRYVAGLARLQLSEEECATFQPQLDAILQYAEKLRELDVEAIGAIAHTVPVSDVLRDVLRDDLPQPSLPLKAVLQNAPDTAQNQIRVPKVIADA